MDLTDQGLKIMEDFFEVATSELGIVYKTDDRSEAVEFGRWFRDRNALAVVIKLVTCGSVIGSFPVNG
jgi:hypothetical protein